MSATVATASPWHAGERAMQSRAGVAERMEATGGRAIRPFMPDQHRDFFAHLPFLVLGYSDRVGDVWASMLTGDPGFVASPDARRLEIAALPPNGDPLSEALAPGSAIGVLGIELPTRRRNRANGRVAAVGASGFSLNVEQSFGNCPKYIVRRDYASAWSRQAGAVEAFSMLDAEARALIGAASTFFVASKAGDDGLPDASHRGGRPGFVRLGEDGSLTVPDYAGNLYFNTLGNFLLDARAGLLFPDFSNGDLLQLTGTVEIQFEGPEVSATAGAQRLWRFFPTRGNWLRGALRSRFGNAESSPFSPEAAAR